MKIIIPFAVVAFCTVLQMASVRGSLETQLDVVNEGITEVQEIMARIRKLQYVRVFKPMLDAIKLAGKNITDVVELHYNETIDHLQEVANNSTAGGKDATGCAETGKHAFQTVRGTALTGIDRCFDTVRGILNTTDDKLDAIIEDAVIVLSFLNSIFTTCYTTDLDAIESCVVQIVPNATQKVERYRTLTVTTLDNLEIVEPVQGEFMTCLNGIGETVEREWNTAESNFDQCVTAL